MAPSRPTNFPEAARDGLAFAKSRPKVTQNQTENCFGGTSGGSEAARSGPKQPEVARVTQFAANFSHNQAHQCNFYHPHSHNMPPC